MITHQVKGGSQEPSGEVSTGMPTHTAQESLPKLVFIICI